MLYVFCDDCPCKSKKKKERIRFNFPAARTTPTHTDKERLARDSQNSTPVELTIVGAEGSAQIRTETGNSAQTSTEGRTLTQISTEGSTSVQTNTVYNNASRQGRYGEDPKLTETDGNTVSK